MNAFNVSTPSDCEIVVTREFNAPRGMVWEAITKPELLKRWFTGPAGWTMTVCEENPTVGGSFHHGWVGPDGTEMTLRGTYHEVIPAERAVRTEQFVMGDFVAGEQRGTAELTDQGEGTLLTITVVYPSKEARDGAINAGMDKGMAAGYNRLDEMLAAELASEAA